MAKNKGFERALYISSDLLDLIFEKKSLAVDFW